MTDAANYMLGYSSDEQRRLIAQSALFEPLTRDAFARAGLGAGMRVLDLGCGVGDVSMLAARMVQPNGVVLGIDRASDSLDLARRRAREAGLDNVAFAAAKIEDFESDQTFDAIVGRFILLYLAEAATTLRRLSSHLAPGGVVAFHERRVVHGLVVRDDVVPARLVGLGGDLLVGGERVVLVA